MAMPDAKASKEELQSVFNSTGHMIEAIERSTETYTGLQNTIRSLPRMTTVLNRGKRRVVQALERLIAEFQKSLRLPRELHDVVKRRIDAQQT